ncbi:transmembrane protein 231 isoform X1 [Apis cerana]|uniref:transmembrane protein 231 isoform X1 n=2 Tax=Apis cerana TaxID=7461 RepID=UPI00109BDE90|nr:transmembrane protein 231 isoform X1 [Apis cerana]
MAAIEIFSSSIDYKYKSKICSLSFLVVLLLIILSLITPFFIIYNTGGFLLKNRVLMEKPDVFFNYKYLLLANRDFNTNPIVCSSFKIYKDNEIEDNCTLIKVREIDTNIDGKNDILKFEAHFYTNKPIKSLKLLLFFNFQLKQLFDATIESFAFFTHVLNEEVQKIQFYGDLVLQQKGLLTSEGLYEVYNHSLEIADYSLNEVFMQNFNKKFTAKINNKYISEQIGNVNENIIVIQGELFYREHLIYYQPNILEELKWIWVQYFSSFLVFVYIARHILIFLFSNRYLNCYIIVPWKNK